MPHPRRLHWFRCLSDLPRTVRSTLPGNTTLGCYDMCKLYEITILFNYMRANYNSAASSVSRINRISKTWFTKISYILYDGMKTKHVLLLNGTMCRNDKINRFCWNQSVNLYNQEINPFAVEYICWRLYIWIGSTYSNINGWCTFDTISDLGHIPGEHPDIGQSDTDSHATWHAPAWSLNESQSREDISGYANDLTQGHDMGFLKPNRPTSLLTSSNE